MNKWQREVIDIEKLANRDMNVGMYKIYDEALKDIQKQIKAYVKDYGELPYYKQQELGKLKAIEEDMVKIVSEVYKDTKATINKHKLAELEDGYYTTMYQLENESGRMLPFMGLEAELMAQSVHHPIAGESLVRRLGTSRDKLAKRATSELRNGMIQGKGYAQIAKAISAHTDANYKQALRIARTEGGIWRSRAKQVAYKEAMDLGVDLKKRWYASLDNRTRSSHQTLDGQEREVEDDFVSPDTGARGPGPRLLGRASEDINCRCTTIAVVDGIAPDSRLAKGVDGYENIKYKNYDDWLGKRVRKDSNKDEGMSLFAGVFVEYALSRDEVITRLADEFGMKTNETSRTKLSEVALNQTYSILERFKPLYNALPQKIPEIKALTKKDAKGAIANYASYMVSRDPVRFGINGEYFKTNDVLEKVVKENVDSGWFGTNLNANHIMMHEFGHHVDFQLSKKNGGSISDLIMENMVMKHGDKYSKDTIAGQVSRYSGSHYREHKDHTETFAEIFAEAYGETPREIALDFKDEFERLAERVIGKW